MDKSEFAERPNRLPWPPLLYAITAAIAFALHWYIRPLPWPQGPVQHLLAAAGITLIAAAIAIDMAAMNAFRSHHTTIMPHRGATALVTDGPFRWSRNPIYVGNTLLVAGAGLLLGVAWLIPAAFAGAILVQKLAIEREEAHLAARFGAAWQDYAARTPRWIRLPR
ncbi:MAG: isoprenylcysteine carboxylmethyltransferase family protein [Rhizobiales bacterium]|nr:isoprenylcysteine carboxylmethyltransferase family protein [Hyphomicrobiales bacterium]